MAITDREGRIIVRGKPVSRGKAKRADYILYYKPKIPIAIIEAKDNNHSVGDGMQQALDYATTLNTLLKVAAVVGRELRLELVSESPRGEPARRVRAVFLRARVVFLVALDQGAEIVVKLHRDGNNAVRLKCVLK